MARYLWIYRDSDSDSTPELWLRTGECTRCGECCELHWLFSYHTGRVEGGDAPPISNVVSQSQWDATPIVAEDWEGYWRYWQKGDSEQERVPCNSYDDSGICVFHDDPDRPEICRKWPVMPSDVIPFPGCGFSFRKAEE